MADRFAAEILAVAAFPARYITAPPPPATGRTCVLLLAAAREIRDGGPPTTRGVRMAGEIEKRLAAMGVTLPVPAPPAATYQPVVEIGGMLYVSGQIPLGPSGPEFVGKLGRDFEVETGRQAARLCGINILAQAKVALGDLDRIKRFVKLTGFVNCTPDFGDMPKVVNGCSDFLVEVLGDRGRHARSAVGMSSLPWGVAVEVEAIIAIN
jgi:enamine deaminase RidA (YjgF/YER057c/UK114 family)